MDVMEMQMAWEREQGEGARQAEAPPVIRAADVPAQTVDEAGQRAREELGRFLAVAGSLEGDDWAQPTDCTEWSVRDILAHAAGSAAGWASWGEFLRQVPLNPYARQAAVPVDGINRRQLEDRVGRSPKDLIAELRAVAPKAIRTRLGLPGIFKGMRIDLGPPRGKAPLRYLLEIIYTRDMWMHRHDICRATGRTFEQTAAHDGRVVALVMRDIDEALRDSLGGRAIRFDLRGAAGGGYLVGPGAESDAVVEMDVLEFNRMASGRLVADDALADGRARTTSGDRAFAEDVLRRTLVLY
jgi:uncharacterized protein (TIGR03083 family)